MATTFDRKFLKEEFPELIQIIQKNHVVGDEVYHELYIAHKPVVNLCHTRGHFAVFHNSKGPLYLQYTMAYVIQDVEAKLIGRAVEDVTHYETFIEYEAARVKAMSSVAANEQTGLNQN